MKFIHHSQSGFGQFRWVVLLLAVAVILPTVCLLWFMHQVVKSERLVVRQRLTMFYKGRLVELAAKVRDEWAQACRQLERRSSIHPYRQFVSAIGQGGYEGLLIYDEAGQRLYPVLSTEAGTLARPSEDFRDIWEMEFINQRYEQAAEMYEERARISDDQGRLAAYIGKSRCFAKLGRIDQAIAECRLRAAFSPLAETGDSRCLSLIANARLLLLSWMQDNAAYTALYEETFRRLLAMLYHPNGAGFALPADENLFLARKILEIGDRTGLLERNAVRANDDSPLHSAGLTRLLQAEEQSIRFAEQFPAVEMFDDWPADQLRPLPTGTGTLYGISHRTGRGTCIALVSRSQIVTMLVQHAGSFQGTSVDCRILDDAGRLVAGVEGPLEAGEAGTPEGRQDEEQKVGTGEGRSALSPSSAREPFASGAVAPYFPGWTVQLFFKDGDVFKRAASEQIAVYTWTGLLFILLILGSGAVAARSIGHQVRLNRLKNDFIATVTHELKTPLASMRVLVDTLLEGTYRDPNQVTDYLQLISRENERLSRLIDNFLTFSRMERNKQAFQRRPTSPASIARTAAEAVKTKFGRGHCRFELVAPDRLPDIKADPDALVTVLVNLLDNAYKYSPDDKQIQLAVTSDDKWVRFRVSDNGLGIPRRALKKIFRRFYQVDRSLSRRAEGCGLGLSIAKFIVEAHQGTIAVESKPGQGSTFTVAIPTTSPTA